MWEPSRTTLRGWFRYWLNLWNWPTACWTKKGVKQDTEFAGNDETFYFHVIKNAGFYTICDQERGYLHPVALQSWFVPLNHVVDSCDNEDLVIALKCLKWPKDIWMYFKKRQPGHLNLEQLKGDLIK